MEEGKLKIIDPDNIKLKDLFPSALVIETDEPKKSCMSEERKAEVFLKLKTAIPVYAKMRRDVIAANCANARLCILDAFAGRLSNGLATNSKKSKWIYTIFCIQTSEILLYTVLTACALNTLGLFIEPENACSNSSIYKAFQIGIMVIYCFDIALKMGYEGVHEYFSHNWQTLYVIITALQIIDMSFNGCIYFCNPLRPTIGVLRARSGRRFFEVLKKMAPGMSRSLVPILFFIVIIMVVCSLAFDDRIQDFTDPSYVSYNWFFLIFTNDNFSRMLPEHMFKQIAYLCFFFPAIYVGQKFLLSLIIGDTYETFIQFVKKQVEKERLKEMQGLTKAFKQLDDIKQGVISASVWRVCINTLHPEISNEAVALYYELLSGGNKDGITVLQFLSLRSVLAFKLMKKENKKGFINSKIAYVQQKIRDLYHGICIPVPSALAEFTSKLVKFCEKIELDAKLNDLDVLILSFSLSDYQYFSSGSPLFWLTPCAAITLLYLLEYIIRVVASKGRIDIFPDNGFIHWLFILGSLGLMADLLVTVVSGAAIAHSTIVRLPFMLSIQYRKVLLFFRACRCLRMASINSELKNFSSALIDITPALMETFTFTFIITYMFGTLGNLLFGRVMEEWGTPLRSVVKAQQLTFMVSFLDSIENAMTEVHPSAVLFFVIYLILSLTVSNIALSIIIDLHANVLNAHSSKEREAQKNKMNLVFEQIVARARTRTIFTSELGNLNFKNITMSNFQSSSVRHFVADSKDGESTDRITLDHIKACAKHSNIDLVKYYLEQHRNHKDVNWEVDFLKNIDDSGVGTTVSYKAKESVFTVGEPANALYFLKKGSCNMIREFEERTIMLPSHFVGTEALQPNGKYQMSCVAENEATLLVIKQEELIQKVDEALMGAITRMAFKSHSVLMDHFVQERKMMARSSTNAGRGTPTIIGTLRRSKSMRLTPPSDGRPPLMMVGSTSSGSTASSEGGVAMRRVNTSDSEIKPVVVDVVPSVIVSPKATRVSGKKTPEGKEQ